MAPVTQVAAAACIAAFCSARTAFAQSLPKAVGAPDEVYTDVNLVRRGKLTVIIPLVTKNETIVSEVVSALPALAGDACANVGSVQATTAEGFFFGFSGDSPKYAELFQGALETGLAGMPTYPEQPWGQGDWAGNNVVANLGFILNSKSTEVGCGITQGCTNPNKNLLLCKLNPPPQAGEQPFSKEYFSALKARTTKIQDMSSSDVNPDGSGASFPSLLLAAFAGVMALASI